MTDQYSENGVIGKSGTFYPCEFYKHIETCLKNKDDASFVTVHCDSLIHTEVRATRQQFETAMDWCTYHGYVFDDCAIHPIWDIWKQGYIAQFGIRNFI